MQWCSVVSVPQSSTGPGAVDAGSNWLLQARGRGSMQSLYAGIRKTGLWTLEELAAV